MNNLNPEIIQNKVLNIVQKIKDSKESFSPTAYLASQGIDSLDMFDILIAIQAYFGVEIDIDMIAEEEWSTIDRITQKISTLLTENSK